MKILMANTYYHPYVSGVTVYAQRLAEALAAHGHAITVVTSQYDKGLRVQDQLNGVRVLRIPVQFWISKGAIMLGYAQAAFRLVRENEAILMHLPNTFVEAFLLVLYAKLFRRPIIGIYNGEVFLPETFFNRIVNGVVFLVNLFATMFCDVITTNTEDFARRSPVLRHFQQKVIPIPPPILVGEPQVEVVEEFKQKFGGHDQTIIGFLGRVAAEKGIHHLIEALPLIREVYPRTKMVFAGENKLVIGEQAYSAKIQSILEKNAEHVLFLGLLPQDQVPSYLQSCDVFVLPSVNLTESFGMVQVESMYCGTPVVASNLPGMRVPVQKTGMGVLAEPANPKALADAILQVLHNRNAYVRPKEEIEKIFSLKVTLEKYIEILTRK